MIKRLISLSFPSDCCNLSCEYCYINKSDNTLKKTWLNKKDVSRYFSLKRLGGTCLINVCSSGEPLMDDNIIDIIVELVKLGHYVMLITNGTLRERINRLVDIPPQYRERLFFKFSFHYEELLRKGLLGIFFDNINYVKSTECSLTVELVGTDSVMEKAEEIKAISLKNLGTYPHVSIPRDERQNCLGLLSKYTLKNYTEKWKSLNLGSAFFDFKSQTFEKHIDNYCYSGERSIWISMADGSVHQCYGTPVIQNFFDDSKPLKWLPIGKHCPFAHCYNSHSLIPLGIVDAPRGVKIESFFNIRNRICADGSQWVKPAFYDVFMNGVERTEHSYEELVNFEKENTLLPWKKTNRDKVMCRLLTKWLRNKMDSHSVEDYFLRNSIFSIAIYGCGDLGQLLEKELRGSRVAVKYMIDRNANDVVMPVPVILPESEFEPVDGIVITPILDYSQIKTFCENKVNCEILSIESVIWSEH